MPIKKYNEYFGGDAEKAYAALIKQYGEQKGKSVFYALIAKRKKAHGSKEANSQG